MAGDELQQYLLFRVNLWCAAKQGPRNQSRQHFGQGSISATRSKFAEYKTLNVGQVANNHVLHGSGDSAVLMTFAAPPGRRGGSDQSMATWPVWLETPLGFGTWNQIPFDSVRIWWRTLHDQVFSSGNGDPGYVLWATGQSKTNNGRDKLQEHTMAWWMPEHNMAFGTPVDN
jgi:hypothetical protein